MQKKIIFDTVCDVNGLPLIWELNEAGNQATSTDCVYDDKEPYKPVTSRGEIKVPAPYNLACESLDDGKYVINLARLSTECSYQEVETNRTQHLLHTSSRFFTTDLPADFQLTKQAIATTESKCLTFEDIIYPKMPPALWGATGVYLGTDDSDFKESIMSQNNQRYLEKKQRQSLYFTANELNLFLHKYNAVELHHAKMAVINSIRDFFNRTISPVANEYPQELKQFFFKAILLAMSDASINNQPIAYESIDEGDLPRVYGLLAEPRLQHQKDIEAEIDKRAESMLVGFQLFNEELVFDDKYQEAVNWLRGELTKNNLQKILKDDYLKLKELVKQSGIHYRLYKEKMRIILNNIPKIQKPIDGFCRLSKIIHESLPIHHLGVASQIVIAVLNKLQEKEMSNTSIAPRLNIEMSDLFFDESSPIYTDLIHWAKEFSSKYNDKKYKERVSLSNRRSKDLIKDYSKSIVAVIFNKYTEIEQFELSAGKSDSRPSIEMSL